MSRFRPAPSAEDPLYTAVPDDGLCLNVFLLFTDRPGSSRVLLGRIDPTADWAAIGGMTPQRVQEVSTRWMLPSRQLFLFESPQDACHSIAETQLGLDSAEFEPPLVTSEAWSRPKPAGTGLHWDLSFLFRGIWPAGRPVRAVPWRELSFHDTSVLDPKTVGRSHADVLALAGFPAFCDPQG